MKWKEETSDGNDTNATKDAASGFRTNLELRPHRFYDIAQTHGAKRRLVQEDVGPSWSSFHFGRWISTTVFIDDDMVG